MKLQSIFLGLLAGLAALPILACGSGGGTLSLQVTGGNNAVTAASGSQGKSLFSNWTETNNYYVVDLRNAGFGVTSAVTITTLTSQNCVCQTLIQGTNASGQASFSSCSGTYPNCASFNTSGASGTYTNDGATLRICLAANSCDTFY